MKKKIIKRKNLLKTFSVNNILKQQMTTRSDLEFLAKKLDLDIRISWLKDILDPLEYKGAQIINLGNKTIGGSHWVCCFNGVYFDSFGLIPPSFNNLDKLEYHPLHIQDQKKGFCGNYVILFLYYAKLGEIDQFYNLFETI